MATILCPECKTTNLDDIEFVYEPIFFFDRSSCKCGHKFN